MKFKGNLADKAKGDVLGLTILWVVYHAGGTIHRKTAQEQLESMLGNVFEPKDAEPEDGNREPHRWFRTIDEVIQRTRNNGDLSRPNQKSGVWVISEKGKQRIESLKAGSIDRDSGITLVDLKQNLNFPNDDGSIPIPPTQPTVSEPEPQPAPVVASSKSEPEIADPPANYRLLPYFQKKGYPFTPFQIATFYSALKTKGFVILSGLSGTGKTKLAQHFGELFGNDRVWFESVRPDWRDSKNLLGFVNPLLDGKYHSTGLLRFLLQARDNAFSADPSSIAPHFLILDEMNLAHVEYYFAEFLSVLESRRISQGENVGFTREAIHLHSNVAPIQDANGEAATIPNVLRLPPNLYIVGTVNVDETTFAFSPKVLDRAFTIEFRDVDLDGYNPSEADEAEASIIAEKIRANVFVDFTRNGKFIANSKDDVAAALDEFDRYKSALIERAKALEPYDLHFGYRVLDEIALFFTNAREAQNTGIIEFDSDDAVLDAAVLMKVLPKIHGSRQKLEEPLTRILRWSLKGKTSGDLLKALGGENAQKSDIPSWLEQWDKIADKFAYPQVGKKALRMLHALYATGFASFA